MSSRIYWRPYPPLDRIGGCGMPFKKIIKDRFMSCGQSRVILSTTIDIVFLLGVLAGTDDRTQNDNLHSQIAELVDSITTYGEVELWEE